MTTPTKNVPAVKTHAPFQVVRKTIPCRHAAQLTLDYGRDPGPWILIGINATAVGIGYLPQKKRK